LEHLVKAKKFARRNTFYNATVFATILFCQSQTAYAWNKAGHEVIAAIAYDNLSVSAKKFINKQHPHILKDAIWLDQVRGKCLRKLHYIDMPYPQNAKIKINKHNAVWALNTAYHELKTQQFTEFNQDLAYKILLHVVGDIHQPLHAITHVTAKSPYGDKGGNNVKLKKNKVANNLHAYWDRGAGLLYKNPNLKALTKAIERQYPCKAFNTEFAPEAWSLDSYNLAKDYAYRNSKKINFSYQSKAQVLCKKQLALAGCRLAAAINALV
jgi:S1/P1 Nuclease